MRKRKLRILFNEKDLLKLTCKIRDINNNLDSGNDEDLIIL